MSRLEEELRTALRREDPSPDFTDRVMARIAALPAENKQGKERKQTNRRPSWPRRLAEFFERFRALQFPGFKWATAAGLVCLLMFAAIGIHRYREHQRAIVEMAEGEKAKEQVMLAMKIASAKLNAAQKKVQATSDRESDAKQ